MEREIRDTGMDRRGVLSVRNSELVRFYNSQAEIWTGRNRYDERLEWYNDLSPAERYHYTIKEVLIREVSKKCRGKVVLDAGCGWGGDLIELHQPYSAGFGFDLSVQNIHYAKEIIKRKNLNHIHLGVADLERVPLRDSTVDIVILSEVLEHLYHPLDALQEIRRILKEDGTLYLTTPNGTFAPDRKRPREKDHVYLHTPTELTKMLRESGFTVQNVFGGALLIPPFCGTLLASPTFLRFWKTLDRILSRFPAAYWLKRNLLIEAVLAEGVS
jgi:ubiquinone/menaquinone biosynthesis C-methylase UbiE